MPLAGTEDLCPLVSARIHECPCLPEFSCLIEFPVSAPMYTKFSGRLSIKYPDYTEYPCRAGKACRERPSAAAPCIKIAAIEDQSSTCRWPLLVDQVHTEPLQSVFANVPASNCGQTFKLQV